MEIALKFFLLDFPEALVSIVVGLSLFNLPTLSRWKKLVLYSILQGASIGLFDYFGVRFELKVACLLVLMNLYSYLLLRHRMAVTIFVSIFAFSILALGEFILVFVFQMLSISVQEILANPIYLYSYMWTYMAMQLILVFFLRKSNFDLRNYLPRPTLNLYLTLLVTVGGLELLAILVLCVRYFVAMENALPLYEIIHVPILNWAILILFILIIYLFRQYIIYTIDRVEYETEVPYVRNIHDMMTAIRSIKHDAVNHYTALDGLLKEKLYTQASDYVKLLIAESSTILKTVEGVKNTAVASLFHSKMAVCLADGITFSIKVTSESQFAFMKTNDMVKVLGNLLDNAIRATLDEVENRYISLEWKETETHECLIIENNGPTIPPEKLGNIFKLGYTTKRNGEGGTGLAIIKKVVNAYKGKIEVESKENVTRFTVTFPK
ncbi:sensor histidine kinase [Brevibacillus dissolubilis]|uniref:sensor histidine kinase n=1 Tax=Brevibacillus dissolubilis TaxID=1844116 RepID=UPI0011176219|nr:ATP-binding protein [Brevibacillus dissolubilis]